VKFTRGRRTTGRHARGSGQAAQPASRPQEASAPEDATGGAGAPEAANPGRAGGPYDRAEAPAGVRRLDLGSLQIPSISGVEVRVQASPDGTVQRVVLVHGTSALRLAAFAAPRSEPIWDEVRAEISKSLFAEGVAVREVEGEYGIELRGRAGTKEGPRELRIVGVEGPRWLVRADFQGPAAVDAHAARQLAECLRGLVVDRGGEARPAREPLPLRLSPEMATQIQQQPAAGGRPAAPGRPGGRKPSPRPVTGGPQATGGPNGSGPAAGGP
jgi:hypothetical protein